MFNQKNSNEKFIFSDPISMNQSPLLPSPPPLSLIVTTDPQGTITDANEAFMRELGFIRSELIGHKLANLIHSDMAPELLATMESTVAAGQTWRGIIKYQRKQAGDYWGDATIMPLLKGGQITGVCSVLFQPGESVRQRAEALLRNAREQTSPLLQQRSTFSLSQKLLTLISLPFCVLALLALLQADWLQALITLGVGVPSLLLGWQLLGNLRRLSHSARLTHDDPLLCYLYTGGVDEACILHHAHGKSSAEVRALAAFITHTSDALNAADACRDQFMAQTNEANRNQEKEARAIYQAMRPILADQHLTTAAVTQVQQLAFNVQNMSAQGRGQLKRMGQTTRHQLLMLDQSQPKLNEISSRASSVSDLIEKIRKATEQTLLILEPGTKGQEANTLHPRAVIQQVQQRAESTHVAINTLHLFFRSLTSSAQTALTAIEAGIQASTQTLALTRDIDHLLQTSISLVNRINTLAVEMGDAMHHQSITRATVTQRLEALQENGINAIEAHRKVSHQNEKFNRDLEKLYQLTDSLVRSAEDGEMA